MSNKDKIVKVGNKFAIFCDREKRIESAEELTEYSDIKDLPEHLKDKCKNKDKIKIIKIDVTAKQKVEKKKNI